MNILQCLKKGKKENTKSKILAIDFRKAFTASHHEYIIEIFKFFNYSDYMIETVKQLELFLFCDTLWCCTRGLTFMSYLHPCIRTTSLEIDS